MGEIALLLPGACERIEFILCVLISLFSESELEFDFTVSMLTTKSAGKTTVTFSSMNVKNMFNFQITFEKYF